MGLKFKDPDADEPSFWEQLGKTILMQAASQGVNSAINGALGNYFEGKQLDKQNVWKQDFMERAANQQNAEAERAWVWDQIKDMPDKARAIEIFSGLKDNPELLAAKLGQPLPAREGMRLGTKGLQLQEGPDMPLPDSTRPPGAKVAPPPPAPLQMGPELPLPDSSRPAILDQIKQAKAPGTVPFSQSLRAMGPLEQYAQEDPAGFEWWNKGAQKRTEEAAGRAQKGRLQGILEGLAMKREIEGLKGETARDVARIRGGAQIESNKVRATSKGAGSPKVSDASKLQLRTLGDIAKANWALYRDSNWDEQFKANAYGAMSDYREYANSLGQPIDESVGKGAPSTDEEADTPTPKYTRDDAIKALQATAEKHNMTMPKGKELEDEISKWLANKR